MRQLTTFLVIFFSLILFIGVSYAKEEKSMTAEETLTSLRSFYPQIQTFTLGDRITRLYGTPFSFGGSPDETADLFRQRYSKIFGVEPNDLLPTASFMADGKNTMQLMYNRDTGLYKFTLVIYSQYKDGIPVFRSDIRLLVRNNTDYPLVEASNSLKALGDFQVSPSLAAVDPVQVQQSFLSANKPNLVNYDTPKMVIWAGQDTVNITPALGVEFMAWDGTPASERYLYIIDPANNSIIYQENQLIDVDITGQVNGNASPGFQSEQCGVELSRHLPYAKVTRSGALAYADSTGAFVLANPGSTPVTVGSKVAGRYFITHNQAGTDDSLGQSVTPPGPVTFFHNPSNTEQKRAEVNAYIHANIVRDYLLKYAPSFNIISTQVDFPVYVNRSDGYCPGNAWYDYMSSINFCLAGSGYPNTAFSTVVHHEYGHHVVQCGGSDQGEYGEGMGDVMGLLITDTSGAAYGFYGDCNTPLRDANNNIQYPCSGEIHDCGQLISGCVWATRNALRVTNPTTYRDIISDLAINSVPLHGYTTSITPDITIDYLQLDDDDGNYNNGTPHSNEICTGFGAHNMDCPPMQLLVFNYPNGLPNFVNPAGGTAVRVEVSGSNPQPGTGILHYKTASTWLTVAMTQVSPNIYDAIFPAITCGTNIDFYFSAQTTSGSTVNDPSGAPTNSFSTISATGLTALFQDNFSTNQGWTGTGGSGEWTIGVANGGAGSDTYGGPDPAIDHSPTTDNRVMGNDLTSGTGGDYSADLSQTYWVTSPTINCSGRTNIKVSFYRWLGVEQNTYDHAYFAVKNSSGVWTNLFTNGTSTIDESSWSKYTYDVSTYANNNATFQIRFGLGLTDGGWQYCGWNIDDILVSTAILCDTLNNGTIAGNVTDSQGNVNLCRIHAFDGSGHHGYDTTGTNGAYSINVPPGTYNATFSQADHRDTTIAGIVVTLNNTTTLNVVMQRLKGVVRGTVTGLSQPLANTRVIAQGSGREDTTGINGIYLIDNLTDGVYSILFTNIDFRDTTRTNISVTPGDTTVLNMTMQPLPGWVTGTILDTAGVAIESVFVRLNTGTQLANVKDINSPSDGEPIILALDSTYTNASGYYSMHVASRTYSALFTRHDYIDTSIANVIVTPNDTTNVSPRMTPINHAPIITSPAADTATEHQLFVYLATATDPDGQAVSITFNSYPGWLTVHGDTIQGTPQEGNGSTTFRIFANDGHLLDTLVVALTVIAVNDPPVITSPDSAIATEHVLFTYTATANDPEGLTPSITFIDYASWLSPAGNQLHGTPPEGAIDTSFTVIASDGSLNDTLFVTIRLIPVNDPPIITSPDSTVAMEDTPFSYVAAAVDPEGVTPIISFIRYPSWTSVLGDTIFGTPGSANNDTSFVVVASDGVKADSQLVILQVVQSNDPPTLTSPASAIATEHIPFSYTATATDPDGTTPAISFSQFPGWMNVNGNTISGNVGQATADTSFRVIASDGALADTMIVQVQVILINDSPVIISADSTGATAGQSFTYLAEAFDPEGVTPLITFINYASWMTPVGDNISGIPPFGASDTTFSVIASDGLLADTLLVLVTLQSGCVYTPGDINDNGSVNGVDIVYAVNFFKGAGNLPQVDCGGICPEASPFYAAGDVNGNCVFNGIDLTYFVRYLKLIVPDLLTCFDCPPVGMPATANKPTVMDGSTK